MVDLPQQKGNSMANEEILDGLADIVEEVAGVAKDDVTVDKSFVDDLDIDSLSMVEIAVQAEDKFGVKIPDDELANLKTVGDAVDYITKNSV
jgi:acyl carrier protein